ncbi:hypothetical protein AD928_09640 [Acetobacter cerevisiae]|uniref:Uncharacterized protein n=2 Tax=Acetobacter cerevisiae TaxID=178900 RepID=A0A149Q743_9PROT|nr:hypothetical protein AD928_09640 [Acetobacter cerevisiae]
MMEAGFCMLHFPQRSMAQIERKVLNGMRALQASTLPPEMGKHWREHYDRYQREGSAALRALLTQHLALCLAEGQDT